MYKMLLHILAYVYKYQPQRFDELLAAIAKYHSRLISVQGHVGKVESTMREAKTLQASRNLQAKAKEKQVDLALKEAKSYIVKTRPNLVEKGSESLRASDQKFASSMFAKLKDSGLTTGTLWQALLSSVVGVDALVAILSYISSYSNDFAIDDEQVSQYKSSSDIAKLFQNLRNRGELNDVIIDYLVYRQLVKFSDLAIKQGGDYSDAYVALVNAIDALDKDGALTFGADSLYKLVDKTSLAEINSEEEFVALATAHYDRLQNSDKENNEAILQQRVSLNESNIDRIEGEIRDNDASDRQAIGDISARLNAIEKNLSERQKCLPSGRFDKSYLARIQETYLKVQMERERHLKKLQFLRDFFGKDISEIGKALDIMDEYRDVLKEEARRDE